MGLFGVVAVGMLALIVTRHPLVGPMTALVEVALAAIYMAWFLRVHHNAGFWGVQRYGAGWAVGGWLLPVAFLWIPVVMAADAWRASTGRRDLPWHLRAWWATWLLAWATGVHNTRALPGGGVQRGLFIELGGTTVSAVLSVLAALTASMFVYRLSTAQTARITAEWT
jgi:hypothetical protein